MATSSILGGERAARQADGKGVDRLGPSDSSDSGSDVQGESPMATGPDNPGEWGAVVTDLASDTDASGTGERATVDGSSVADGADILPDRIVDDPGLLDVDDLPDIDSAIAADDLADDADTGLDDDEEDAADAADAGDAGAAPRRAPERRS
jgi:hypothetical protein